MRDGGPALRGAFGHEASDCAERFSSGRWGGARGRWHRRRRGISKNIVRGDRAVWSGGRDQAMSMPCSLARRRALGEIFGAGLSVRAATAVGADARRRICTSRDRTGCGARFGDRRFQRGRLRRAWTIHAMISPTGTTAPSRDFIPARMPSAGASISTTALSVSISRRGSPLVTSRLPFCATPEACRFPAPFRARALRR